MPVTKVIILAGGKGTRLPVSARGIPKPLVEVGGKPILQRQLEALYRAGLYDVRLSLHFRADQIVAFLKEKGHQCDYVIEPEPLGTGGAVRFAMRGLRGPVMVLNGDGLDDFDFPAITRAHSPGMAVVTAQWKDDARDFGLLVVEGDRVLEFREKPQEPVGGYINIGCYIIEPEHFVGMPEGPFMLERDFFPALASAGRLKAHIHRGFYEDLGTEERLARARGLFPKL